MNVMKKLFSLYFALGMLTICQAQLTVTDSSDVATITDWLEGANLSIVNLEINCSGASLGTFSYLGSDLPMTQGIILTSGSALTAIGPNENESSTGYSNNTFGDEDLEMVTGGTVNDVCAIEFDCIPDFDYLLFDYVFGSEEYPEYVNSFNDGFAFFVSGPGISGPYSSPSSDPDGSQNFCTIPNTEMAVTINNVNNGSTACAQGGPAGPCMNCEFYADNCGGLDLQYDGLTTLLPGVVPVQPDATYHVKIAICDVLDSAFDSGVFVQKQSFRSANVLSLDDNPTPEGMTLYPNPASNDFILHGLPVNYYTFKILDSTGRLISQQKKQVTGDLQLDISSLAKGSYLLLMTPSNGESFITEFQKY